MSEPIQVDSTGEISFKVPVTQNQSTECTELESEPALSRCASVTMLDAEMNTSHTSTDFTMHAMVTNMTDMLKDVLKELKVLQNSHGPIQPDNEYRSHNCTIIAILISTKEHLCTIQIEVRVTCITPYTIGLNRPPTGIPPEHSTHTKVNLVDLIGVEVQVRMQWQLMVVVGRVEL